MDSCQADEGGGDGSKSKFWNTMRYRCYFFSPLCRLVGMEDYQSDSDALAVARARIMLDARGSHGSFELWKGSRLVESAKGPNAKGESPSKEGPRSQK
jgi:hypothetical protein